MAVTPAADRVDEVGTPLGPARAHHWAPAGRPVGRLVLGHGAGGGIGAADLTAARRAATAAGWAVVLLEQAWRVAGKRVAPPPPRLDEGWLAVLEGPGTPAGDGLPLVVGGRSAGARVACRTAARLGAVGVCCLAFPLHPPGRPERSRAGELALPGAAGIGVVVLQGESDPFGGPADLAALGLAGVSVHPVPGDHALGRTAAAAAALRPPLDAALAAWAPPARRG